MNTLKTLVALALYAVQGVVAIGLVIALAAWMR
jgi:hypothetical protein